MSSLFINISDLPHPCREFIAWVDVMGIKNIFKKTHRSPMLYILKLHKCAHLIKGSDVHCKIYPVIDGFYMAHDDPEKLFSMLKEIFVLMANEFIYENKIGYRFMIRAGVAVGGITHGVDLPSIREMEIITSIKSLLLFGRGAVDAVEAEADGSPFSIIIHELSRGFVSKYINISNNGEVIWFGRSFDRVKFRDKVIEYYAWIENNPNWVDYPLEKRNKHLSEFKAMIDSGFG
jgi:hypothetical protein